MSNYLPLIAVLLVIGVLFAVYFSPSARKARADKAAERKRADDESKARAQVAFDLFVSGDDRPLPDFNSDVQGVILKGDEICRALSRNAKHIVSRKKTHYVGGSQGVSIRIAKGVRYHVGGFRGQPVTEEFEVVADLGSVYVTNKRFIFAGSKEVTSVPISKIGDVHLDGARVVVIIENRVNPVVIGITEPYWSPVIAAATHRMAQLASESKPSPRLAKRQD